MKLSRMFLASFAVLALSAAPALADEPSASPPSPPAQAAPAPPAAAAPAAAVQAAPAPAAAVQAGAPAPAALPPSSTGGDALDPDVMKKLNGDQVVEVMRQRALIAAKERPDGKVAIAVPIASFVFLLLVVTSGLYFGVRKDRERHETLRAMIQRGASIPPELLVPPVKKFSDLRRGIILVAGGLGVSIFVAATPADKGVWTVGLIPMLIGAGYLVAWKLTRPGPQPVRDEAAIAAEHEVNNL